MISKIETLQADAAIESRLAILRADHVPIMLDGDKFLGLITRIVLLNYLRRRLKWGGEAGPPNNGILSPF